MSCKAYQGRGIVAAAFVGCSAFAFAELPLVPYPSRVTMKDGRCSLSESVISLAVKSYSHDSSIPAEGYRIELDESGLRVFASGDAGAFYAGVTARQLISVPDGKLGTMTIEDAPKFSWRGVHLDEARHFFGKEFVLRLLKSMACFKLNVLHWHLTDDEGWRLPVDGFPQLVGAVRPVENRRNFCDLKKDGTYGPFGYSEDDIREIVRFAAGLHIRIVPEVEIPGHSRALLNACPQLACSVCPSGKHKPVDNVCCVGKDTTIRFFERALDVACRLFPDSVIHIGGDECDRGNWERCPDCQAKMRELGAKGTAELQSLVTAHFERYLASKGRRLMGWDEVAEGGLPPGAMVMSWRGTTTGILAAKAGHDVVMTPTEWCYFDYDQGIEGDEKPYPFNWTCLIPPGKVYSLDPLLGIPDSYHRHVLGAQGNNWTEMSRSPAELEWKMWPRAAVLAEVLWSYPQIRDFDAFARRLEPRLADLMALDVNPSPVHLQRCPERPQGRIERVKEGGRDMFRYVCGQVSAVLTLENGRLKLEVSGRPVRTFVKTFDSMSVQDVGNGAKLVTANRPGGDVVATILFDGSRVVAKDRWDEEFP